MFQRLSAVLLLASAFLAAQVNPSTLTRNLTPAQAAQVMSATDVFGPNPWLANPTLTTPFGVTPLNSQYFANSAPASLVATMLGGTVVSVNQLTTGLVTSNQPTLMVQLPSGAQVNAGLVEVFFTHGYTLGTIQGMLQAEVANVQNETLGQTVQAGTIAIAMPTQPAPPPPTAQSPGSCGPVINGLSPAAYNMWNPMMLLNGLTIPNPPGCPPGTYTATVWSNPLFGTFVGRWTLVQ